MHPPLAGGASAVARRPCPRSVPGALILAVLVASPWTATAQPDAAGSVVDTLDVVLVNVEVWVQDEEGRPIRGLTADDFEVLEDGKPVTITHLAEIKESPVTAGPERPSSQDAARRAPIATEAEDPPHLVIYFDQMHQAPGSAKRLVEDLRRFLGERQVPAPRVAILRQGFQLQAEADFGSTPEELDAALTRIAESQPVAGGALDARASLDRLQHAWEMAKQGGTPATFAGANDEAALADQQCRRMAFETKSELRTRIPELEQQFSITLASLHATTRFLAGLPGVKILVLVSDSLETRPGAELLRFAQNLCPYEPELNDVQLLGDSASLQQTLLDFTRHANANRVTFYALQTGGLTPSVTSGPENRAFGRNATRGVDSALRNVQRDGLVALAVETGGVAVFDRNSFGDALESMARDMRNYYSLAYAPPHAGDGGHHSIEVRLKDGSVPGKARIRHRLGYRDKSPTEVLDERLEGAIAFGLMDNPLDVRLAAGTIEEAGEGRYSIPLHLLVPTTGIAFLPATEGDRARLEVRARASKADTGHLVEAEQTYRPVRPPDDAMPLDLRLVLELPEGVHVLALSLRDLATGATSVVATTVAIHDPSRRQADS